MIQKENTNITIFTDMSHKNTLTGFAFYIRSNYSQIKQAGCFENTDNNSFKNEMMTVCKALKYAKARHEIRLVKNVYIYCDNQRCIDTLEQYGRRTLVPFGKDMDFLAKMIIFLNGIGWTFVPRKVKAHDGVGTLQKKINDWMDKEAKKARIDRENKLGWY